MDIIKIIGIGLIALIVIIIIKQYRPEFAVYVSLIAGALILLLILDKMSGVINLLTNLANKTSINKRFYIFINKNYRNSIFNRICS